MTTSAPVIALTGITRTFDADARTGIHDVSLSIERGEFVAIVGPSGAGKSTLLNVLGLLDRPDAGEYLFNGVDLASLTEHERDVLRSSAIGFVFQSSFVLGDQSALRNAALGLRIQGRPMPSRSERSWTALTQLGIASSWSTAGRLLSGGERQRLALARAIATDPDVILADEPTGNLDSENSRIVVDYLRALNEQGTTVVIITHDPEIASQAPRQIHIVDGRASEPFPSTPVRGSSASSGIFAQGEDRSENGPGARPPHSRGSWRERVLDDLGDALSALSQRVLRSLLLVLAFVLGISGLIAAVGLSESASAQISERLTDAALDEVRIDVAGGADLLGRNSERLENWLSELEDLPHVERVGFVAAVPASAAHIRRLSNAEPPPDSEYFLVVASSDYLEMMGVSSTAGAPLALLDDERLSGAVWVGEDVAKGLGLPGPGAGASLWAVGRRLDVVGYIAAGARAPQFDRMIVVTPDVISGLPEVGVRLVVRTEPGFPAAVADAAPLALDPSSPGAFRVETVADLRNLRFGVANDLGTFVAILSAILLALATVSASTTMYLSVQSRAQEIALRRAIGSSRFGVARLFVAEGLLIGAAGGSAGALIGTIAALLGAYAQGWTPVLPPGLAPLAVALGIATGLLSAVVPAWSASKQEPAAAIRN